MIKREQAFEDLAPFCDIGSGGPKVTERDGKVSVKMTKDARQLSIVIDQATLKTQVSSGSGQKRYFSSFAKMLADDMFSNLRRWSDSQKDFLKGTSVQDKDLIPFRGKSGDELIQTVQELSDLLGGARPAQDSTEVLLIDGPAGIGKTTLIEKLALHRAESYKTLGEALVLHVKSRGRVLSNLQDLMAFSLQTLRLTITYDQIPVLVKHGLVVLAIDGFDELGDPSGYELAWAQINELTTSIRGKGALILAGRDTFIGRGRLLRDVKSLRADVDLVNELVLDSGDSSQAREWLSRNPAWTSAALSSPAIAVLLEDGSYALRPVFLRLLRDNVKPKDIVDKSPSDLTGYLVGYMLDREATKFGDAVEQALGKERLRAFVGDFLQELARDMADSQAESVDTAAIMWIAEAALGSGWPDQVISLIKNRAAVMAFLADDERPGHKRFSHAQIMSYFLAQEALKSISKSDVPKYVRRNILGSEFLNTFGDLALQVSANDPQKISQFVSSALSSVKGYSQIDRGARNLGALLLAVSPAILESEIRIGGFQVDDAVIRGTVPQCTFHNMIVRQLDIRGADLSCVSFEGCTFVQLIADEGTRVSPSFPGADALVVGDSKHVTEVEAVANWLDLHGRSLGGSGVALAQLEAHPAYKLLSRACRLRQYWLRSEGDQHAARILNDGSWPVVEKVLRKHDFLREEVRQASGKSSTFFHIRQAERFIGEERSDGALRNFFEDLLAEAGKN